MPVRVATASVNQTPLDWSGNRKRIVQASEEAMKGNPEAILFPELCISGYGCEDAFHMPEVWKRSEDSLGILCEKLWAVAGSVPVVVGLPFMHLGLLYNVSAVIHRGRVAALVPKQHLAGDGIHYEPRWFHPFRGGPDQTGEQGIPFGPTIFDTGRFRFIIEICEDSWVDNRPASQHAGSSFDCVLSPTASHFAIGKQRLRRQIALETSRAFHCTYISVNLLGNEAGRAIYDGQTLACQTGSLLLESPAFSFKPFTVHHIEFDPEPNRSRRVQTHSFRESISVPPGSMVESATVRLTNEDKKEFGFQLPEPQRQSPRMAPIVQSELKKRHGDGHLEFLYATTLALFDYLRKSHSRGYAISLSGGADSAACSVLVERMIRYGVAELGLAGFLQAIHREDLLEDAAIRGDAAVEASTTKKQNPGEHQQIDALVSQLLFTVYQATAQSSETTRTAAARIAGGLGAHHREVSIQSIVEGYVGSYEEAYQRKLDWSTDDLVLQNIQARARSPLVWMLANATGSLLISTGNRSEGSVGYCTMDGDTSGGLAPIAGIDKHFLRGWLRFMELQGDPIFGTVPELDTINNQQPTAELRPENQHQTDEADLMPYDVLNRIQKLAVRDRMGPAQILQKLLHDASLPARDLSGQRPPSSSSDESAVQHQTERENEQNPAHPWNIISSIAGSDPQTALDPAVRPFQGDYSRADFAGYIRKFFQLWSRNQWKRERIAVSFHLDDENIDPRTFFRFPILSAGFLEELDDLSAD
ncbi:MAG: NAD(+) synthase [Leptospiraceae bacterium]|nr:NAD(+) synthase [Leptospiraceae bacterium]